MTEEQAIERITAALRRQAHGIDAITGRDMAPAIARTAWNEIKAIAREDARPPDEFDEYVANARHARDRSEVRRRVRHGLDQMCESYTR